MFARGRMIPRSLQALGLLAVLLLGFAGHALHHLVDHDCGAPANPHHDACAVCASLHGGSPAAVPVAVAAPALAPLATPFAQLIERPAAVAPRISGARAPPVA